MIKKQDSYVKAQEAHLKVLTKGDTSFSQQQEYLRAICSGDFT